MKKNIINFILSSTVILFGLSACKSLTTTTTITGLAYERQPLPNAQITLIDASGKQFKTETNALGIYNISTRGVTLPILVSVVSQGKAEDCANNSRLRPICLAALVNQIPENKNLVVNINPLTDRVVSDIAVSKGFIGPQQWVDSNAVGAVDTQLVNQALTSMRNGFSVALTMAGIENTAGFDPATFAMTDTNPVTEIFSLLHHNRNYDNNTGSTGHTSLTDFSFRPIVGLMPNGAYEPFDLQRARDEYQRVKNAKTRIFIVGDSTSAVYEQLRYPRMGWGQALAAQFKTGSGIEVIVGSRAGRSSRDFYNGRWFTQMDYLIQVGDYVFINHGHNDQNCDSRKALRGPADVKNLCTYPNDQTAKPQFPAGHPELSFQHSLERYIKIAQERGAHPVMFTPTARIKNKNGEQTTPVVHTHLTRQNASNGYLLTGDYTETIKTTAKLHKLPLIDLEAASIDFANKTGEPGWRNYWLVVDPAINPFYANNAAGSIQMPDGTHFQKNGAEAIAKLVAEAIKKNQELIGLHRYLN
ncbi:GDSL-type esterase/lipase family protein [Cellvibrio mixtus]|uniref:GDSL-type esterase/lipase family protein n=1 Tax=Cellvibrio mixtus TaxID=39650 RepID=UPI0005869E19|nr:SGNH/GDSL hydrolase family protein [Cellvibrio mixtus]